MKTAALHSLGCKVNSYETEAMRQLLIDGGYRIVPFGEKADVYVINTCSVTNIADKKSRQMLHRARALNPDAVVIAAGCYAQTSTDKAKGDSAVDLVIGNNKKQDLLRIIEEYERSRAGNSLTTVIDINDPSQPYEELKVSSPIEHTRAFLKIQDGCDNFCSYCIIPYARGRARSRNEEDIVNEAEGFAARGFKEVVLTGINICYYGRDTGRSLIELIRKINDIEGIRRIRFGSVEPVMITDEFMRELSSLPKVCPHFHLSLQSGSDSVLKRMNRKYTTEEYLEKCRLIRRYYEHPAITTDIITGFPGETQEEFEETLAFLRKAGFYEVHVFKYSRRAGTAADRMPGQIPDSVKTQRSRQLISQAALLKEEFLSWYKGKTAEVLFEESCAYEDGVYYTGFTPEYIKVRYRSDENLRNLIMNVEFSADLL